MNKPTQAELILSILAIKQSITADQLKCLDIKNPSAVISRLIQRGYLIDITIVTKKVAPTYACRTQITYRLRKKYIKPLFGRKSYK